MRAAFLKVKNNQKLTTFLPTMSKFIDHIKDEEISGENLPLFSVFNTKLSSHMPSLTYFEAKKVGSRAK